MPSWESLSAAERRTYLAAAVDGAERVTSVRVLDLDHRLLSEDPAPLVEGQVDVSRVRMADVRSLTTRVFTASLLDEARRVSWDADSPSPLALWPNRMLQVVDGRYVDGLGLVRHRVFTGPVVSFAREGALVTPTCYGKEFLAQRELGQTMRWAAGTRVVRVMRELLEAVGETRFDLPELDVDLPERLTVAATANVWRIVQRLARQADVQAYYTGAGRFRVRRLPGNPSMVWTQGEGGSVVGQAKVTSRLPDEFANVQRVSGRRLPGRKRRARGSWRPRPSHDLSPETLARGGEPGVFRDRVRRGKVATDAAADRLAARRGRDRLRLVTDAAFAGMPGLVPIDEGDLHTLVDPDFGRVRFRVREFSAAFSASSPEVAMTINRLRRQTSANRR